MRRPTKLGALVLLILFASSCSLKDYPIFLEWRRPPNVPKDSVFVEWPKGGVWEHCVYVASEDADKCQMFNWGGGVISDGVYLPYDGGPSVKGDQLRIRRGVSPIMGNAICLENGRALLPKWLVDRHKEGSFQEFFNPGCPGPPVRSK